MSEDKKEIDSFCKEDILKILKVNLKKMGYDKITNKELSDFFNASFYTISDVLRNGYSVTIKGVGSFEVKDYQEKNIRDIQTGEIITIAKTRRTKFTASHDFGIDPSKIFSDTGKKKNK